ncbi:hypothetical protein D9615_002364 [Tricholomella constricta]|uniref:Uncharacterized protein n=1 Tax=Tricholomella constricta TaxID=117010 RepID=A0A8H5HMM5_9AGAR|nr:hypothetical protein D9615_002364 [Tricholomella constricta]
MATEALGNANDCLRISIATGMPPPSATNHESTNVDSEPGTKMVPWRSPIKNLTRRKVKSPKVPQKKAARLGAVASSSEGELFDFDVSSTDKLPDTTRKRGRPRKSSRPAATPTTKRKATASPTQKGRLIQKDILCAGSLR